MRSLVSFDPGRTLTGPSTTPPTNSANEPRHEIGAAAGKGRDCAEMAAAAVEKARCARSFSCQTALLSIAAMGPRFFSGNARTGSFACSVAAIPSVAARILRSEIDGRRRGVVVSRHRRRYRLPMFLTEAIDDFLSLGNGGIGRSDRGLRG